jgi:hypothetical protein
LLTAAEAFRTLPTTGTLPYFSAAFLFPFFASVSPASTSSPSVLLDSLKFGATLSYAPVAAPYAFFVPSHAAGLGAQHRLSCGVARVQCLGRGAAHRLAGVGCRALEPVQDAGRAACRFVRSVGRGRLLCRRRLLRARRSDPADCRRAGVLDLSQRLADIHAQGTLEPGVVFLTHRTFSSA